VTGPILALIPARGGSKGIPRKNVRPMAGRPLIAYAVEAAARSGVIDRIVVSTDDKEIADAARAAGAEVPFVRPAALAGDETPMIAVITHTLATLGAQGFAPDIVVLLQPTAPLRKPSHVRQAVVQLRLTQADSVVSVTAVPQHLCPDYVMRRDADGRLRPFLAEGAAITRRQDVRPAYTRDGTVYAFWRRTLDQYGDLYGADCRALLVPAQESVNVDTPDDWDRAERLLRAGLADA